MLQIFEARIWFLH